MVEGQELDGQVVERNAGLCFTMPATMHTLDPPTLFANAKEVNLYLEYAYSQYRLSLANYVVHVLEVQKLGKLGTSLQLLLNPAFEHHAVVL
jgi:hypothetical protein